MSATVVVGWDASAPARAALGAAARLADGGRLVVVHAHEPQHAHTTARWQELAELDDLERSRALLEGAVAHNGCIVELRSADGPPADALLRVADEVDADAIAVGPRGLGTSAAVVGSVSEALLRASGRPILVVPVALPAAYPDEGSVTRPRSIA